MFCDKTGTLTQNELRFRALILKGEYVIRKPNSEVYKEAKIKDLVRCICLCNDVNRVDGEKNENFLTGSSQDELVLLEMVENEKLGTFVERN